MLHIVNRSPFSHRALAECLRGCDAAAGILLIEDGVYAALAGGEWLARMRDKTDRIHVLAADVAARGLAGRIDAAARSIDYAGFVALCCEYPGTLSWY